MDATAPGSAATWGERATIPYLKEQAEAPGARLEGATKADAMLLARGNGVAVVFEAKVLSDISAHVTFDLARNQLARSINVMLDAISALAAPLHITDWLLSLPKLTRYCLLDKRHYR